MKLINMSLKEISGLILILLILSGFVLCSGCMQAEEKKPAGDIQAPDEEASPDITAGELALVAFVDDAAEYAKQNGKDAAILAYNDKNGDFSDGDLYIYAYDFEGNLLAHPYLPEKVGTNRLNWTTANGLFFVKAAIDAAEEGSGFIMYMYPAPGTEDGINESSAVSYEPKIGYVKKIDSGMWIGSGIYLNDFIDKDSGVLPDVVEDAVSLTESAVSYAKDNGKEAALEEISKKNGTLTDGDLYIYAYDYNGTLLAHPYLTDDIGKNLIGKTGPYGVHSIEVLSKTAGNGGGFVVFGWENPSLGNKPELKLGYVLPVDDEWWLGSGVYMSDLTKSLNSAQ